MDAIPVRQSRRSSRTDSSIDESSARLAQGRPSDTPFAAANPNQGTSRPRSTYSVEDQHRDLLNWIASLPPEDASALNITNPFIRNLDLQMNQAAGNQELPERGDFLNPNFGRTGRNLDLEMEQSRDTSSNVIIPNPQLAGQRNLQTDIAGTVTTTTTTTNVIRQLVSQEVETSSSTSQLVTTNQGLSTTNVSNNQTPTPPMLGTTIHQLWITSRTNTTNSITNNYTSTNS